MPGLSDKIRDAENINHEALVLRLTYTLTPDEKADKLIGEIHRYEGKYGVFDGRNNPNVARIIDDKS